jgi:electron transport complex protein RnfB
MIMEIITPILAMAGLGLVFGLGLAYALKIFGIKVDPTVALIITKLPGANCGVCGRAGCAGFAEALKKGEASPAGCVLSKDETRKAISEILGIDYSKKIKKIAACLCNGGKNAKDKFAYSGIKTCKAATLIFGGYKMCDYGCLGFGDCANACPFGAINMVENLPKVDMNKCVACGKCIEACPKNLMQFGRIDNAGNVIYVACNSQDKAAAKRKFCSASCIACGICEKLSGGTFAVKDNLSRPDYEKMKAVLNKDEIIQKCPTKVIKKMSLTQ